MAALEAAGETDYERYRPRVAGTRANEAYLTGDWERGVLSVVFSRQVAPVAAIFDQLLKRGRPRQGCQDLLAGKHSWRADQR